MQEINLYILTEAKGNTPEAGRVAYELEMVRRDGSKAHMDHKTYLPDRNKNGAMLEGLCDALVNHVLEDRDIRMNVYSEAPMMNTHITNGNIYVWEKNGFKKADGSPVAYAELWEQITESIRGKLKDRITMYNGLPFDIRQRLEKMIKDPY